MRTTWRLRWVWLHAVAALSLGVAACAGAKGAGGVGAMGAMGGARPATSSKVIETHAPSSNGPAREPDAVTDTTKLARGDDGGLPSPAAYVAVAMKAPVGTRFVAELQTLGLDATNLPPIEKLDPRALRGAMTLIARSLGVKCAACHVDGDYAASTRNKKIATRMWDEFAMKLALTTDQPLFCDSCHQGRTLLLDRRDKKALGAWMDDNFVAKLRPLDGKSAECETCHVDMEMRLITKWAGDQHPD